MTRLLLPLAATLFLLACPKNAGGGSVTGTDDERMDQYAAQLEEFRETAKGELKCEQWCDFAKRSTEISRSVCEISKRHVDRADMQQKCIQAQEDLTRYNDGCAGCKR